MADQHERFLTAALTLAVVGAMSVPSATIDQRGVRVILPAESPRLTPAAAQVLLRILLKARARAAGDHQEEAPT
jgi:hypothetical protein